MHIPTKPEFSYMIFENSSFYSQTVVPARNALFMTFCNTKTNFSCGLYDFLTQHNVLLEELDVFGGVYVCIEI